MFGVIRAATTRHSAIERIAREAALDFAADGAALLELRTTPKVRIWLCVYVRQWWVAGQLLTHIPSSQPNKKHPPTPNPTTTRLASLPQHHPEHGVTKRSYVEAVLRGLRAAGGDSNSSGKGSGNNAGPEDRALVALILSVDRREGAAEALETVRLILGGGLIRHHQQRATTHNKSNAIIPFTINHKGGAGGHVAGRGRAHRQRRPVRRPNGWRVANVGARVCRRALARAARNAARGRGPESVRV
jgi:hypothetical protein